MARKKKPTPATPTSEFILENIDLEGRLDGEFYQELYRRFKKVAFRMNSKLASDEEWCSDVFFNRVLKINSGCSDWADVDRRVKYWRSRCDSDEGFWRFYNTICHNAIIDEVKSAKAKNEAKFKYFENGDHDYIGIIPLILLGKNNHSRLAEKILSELGKNRRLISLLRTGEVTYKTCEKLVGLKKNIFYIRKKTFRDELETMIRKANSKLNEEEVQDALKEIVKKDWESGVFKW